MGTSSKAVRQFAKDANRMGRQATQIGQTFTRAFTLPIIAGGFAAAKLAIDLESSFAGVRKTVDATETQFAQLAQGFRDLSKEIPINVNAINAVGEAAGQLGIQTENIIEFTRTMSLLGVTTNLSATEAATSLARFTNITGLAQGEIGRLGSTIVALGNSYATTEAEIVDLSLRLAGAGSQIGLSEAQILALAAAMSSLGIRAESGGTALSRVMIEIAESVSVGGERLDDFANVALPNVNDAAAQFAKMFGEDAAGALDLFIQGLGKVEDEGSSIFAVLKNLEFGNVRVRDTMLRLAGAGDMVTRTLKTANTAWQENTALVKEAEERFTTTASQMVLLWNRIKDIGITIGNAMLPMIQAAIRALDVLLPAVAKIADWFGRLPVPIQASAFALAGLVAAIPLAILAFGQLAFAASAMATAFTSSGVATLGVMPALIRFRTFAGSVGRLIPGVTALGGAFVGMFARIRLGALATTTGIGALGISFGALAAPVTAAVAIMGGLALAFQLVRRPIVDLILRMKGMTQEQIDQARASIALQEAVDKVRGGYDDLAATLRAIAARDMAAWSGASDEAKLKAIELSDALPLAMQEADNLARAFLELKEEGQLTPSVLDEIVRRSLALGDQIGALPPVLSELVAWFAKSEKAAEDLSGDGDGGGLDGATEATKKYKEALDALVARLGGGDAVASANMWLDALTRIGGLTNLTVAETEELRGVLSAVRDKFDALGEAIPPGVLAALRELNKEIALTGTLVSEVGRNLPLPSRVLELPTITGLQPSGGGQPGLLARLLGAGPREISDLEKTIGDFASRIPGVIVGAIQGGGDVGGAIGAALGSVFGTDLAESIAETIGGALGQALSAVAAVIGPLAGSILFGAGSRTTTALVLAGAALGATIGFSIAGPLGAAIGAGMGGLVGLFRGIGRSTADNIGLHVGRVWGLSISEELRDTIAEQADEIGSDIGAIMANLSTIIAENGGILAVGLEKSIALTRDLFVMIETGALDAETAGAQLEIMFGQLLPHAINRATGEIRPDFLELIGLMRQFGLESEVIKEALAGALDELVALTAQRSQLLGQVAADAAANFAKLIEDGFGQTIQRLRIGGDTISNAILFREGELETAQRAASTFFSQMIQNGATFQEALEAFGPSILTLRDRMVSAGLDITPTFQAMIDGATIFADEGLAAIITQGQLAGDTLAAMATLGAVTADDFSVLGASVSGAFNNLIAGGASSEAALLALRPQIATLIMLQAEYGFEVDAATQALIDQGIAAGITADDGKTSAQIQIEAFDAMIAALQQIVVLLGGEIPAELDKLSNLDPAVVPVVVEVDDSQLRNLPIPTSIVIPAVFDPVPIPGFPGPGGASSGGFELPLGFQLGTPGLDFGRFGGGTLANLHGDEAVIPRGGGHELAAEIAAAMGGDGGVQLTLAAGAVVVNGDVSGEEILDRITSAIERGGRPVSKFIGAARNQMA